MPKCATCKRSNPESSDTVSLVHAVLVELIDRAVVMTEDEEAKLQEVVDLITDDDGTIQAVDRVLQRIVAN